MGDCQDELPKIGKNTIDLVLTDPPYGIDVMGVDWNRDKIEDLKSKAGVVGGPVGMKFNPEDSVKLQKFLEPVFDQYFNVLKPGGFCLVFSQARSCHRVGLALENSGFELRDQLVWDYGCGQQKAQGIQNFIKKNRELSDSDKEWLTYATNGKKTPQLAPTFETIWLAQKPKEGRTVENYIKWQTGLVNFDGDVVRNRFEYSKPNKYEREVSGNHPTLKPLPLFEELIKRFSNKGGLVLDSFAGSGTTAVAANNTGRRSYCIEFDKQTYEEALKKIKYYE